MKSNGCSSGIERCMWYGWVKRRLGEKGLSVLLEVMPDPRESNAAVGGIEGRRKKEQGGRGEGEHNG